MVLSIITPVLNGERFIRRNIESIMKLETPHEHIIVDGGSNDNTLQILEEYPHLIVVHQTERTGMYGGICIGFEKASGEFITWINCDDWIIPEPYEAMLSVMIKRNADFIFSDAYIQDERTGSKQFCRSSMMPKYFLRHGIMPFIQPSTIYKNSFFQRYPLNSQFKITGDMDMFYRMAADKNAMFVRFCHPTVCFLKYGESLGDKNGNKGRQELVNAGIPTPQFFARLLFYFLRRL